MRVLCVECGEHVNTADCGYYTTIKNTCSNCDGNRYKVTITKEDGAEYWDTVCTNCGADISKYYVDKNCEPIDSKARELLLIGDYLQDIKETIYELKVQVDSAKEELSHIKIKGSKIDSYIVNCIDDIHKLSEKVKEFEEVVWDLERSAD